MAKEEKINFFTLSFKDNLLENEFKEYYINRFLSQIKLAMVLGIFLYIFFGLLDIYLYPDVKLYLLTIRFGLVTPILSTILLLFFIKKFHKYSQLLISITVIVGGFGIIEMIRIIQLNGYDKNIYFSGLLMVAFFAYTFLRIRFIWGIICGVLILIGYEAVTIFMTKIPIKNLIANNFFLITTNIVGMIVNYNLELDSRKYFLLLREIKKEKENLAALNIKLDKLAYIDGLTGIGNKRYLMENLKMQWKYHVNNDTISVLIIDVDYFKKFNDYYGHIEGDKCLKKIAKELENIIRKYKDIVARFGGEEFVILLPNTKKEIALDIANRIKEKIYNLKIPHRTSDVAKFVTVSIGVATLLPTDNNIEKILINADKALYIAKNSGRNKVILYEN